MNLTPAQRRDIERQRAADPTARRFHIVHTPEQHADWARRAAAEQAGRAENIRFVKAQLAERERLRRIERAVALVIDRVAPDGAAGEELTRLRREFAAGPDAGGGRL